MPIGPHDPIPRKEKISVDFLLNQLKTQLHMDLQVHGSQKACKERYVTESDLHRPGLALAGYTDLFTYHRIQILGNTETDYLKNLSPDDQKRAFHNIIQFEVPVIFVTHGNKLPKGLIGMAKERKIPVVFTVVESTRFMFMMRDFLIDQFAVQTMVHGSMVDIYGIGILIAGKSGIGKSEVALDLIERGHRLVADDIVMLTRKNNVLMSSATEMNKHFMEIRGLGIVDVMSMFGIRSIRYQKRLEAIVELFLWEESSNVDRTGLDHETTTVLDVELPVIRLPITPGKNITVIAEVIAMNYLLSHYGYDAAKEFQEKIRKRIREKSQSDPSLKRAIEYFEGDVE